MLKVQTVEETARIKALKHDARGYPIPWNVLVTDGVAHFTVNDDRKHIWALRGKLCPICGDRIGRWYTFVSGPRAIFHEHGWIVDLPGHRDCIEYSLQVCPYLAIPSWITRSENALAGNVPIEVPLMIEPSTYPNRPDLFVAATTDKIEIHDRGLLPAYTRPARGANTKYDYWRHGLKLPEDEALPYLRAALGAEWSLP